MNQIGDIPLYNQQSTEKMLNTLGQIFRKQESIEILQQILENFKNFIQFEDIQKIFDQKQLLLLMQEQNNDKQFLESLYIYILK